MMTFLKKILGCAADLLLPPSCLLCGEYLEDEIYVCGKCLNELPLNRNDKRSSISVFDYVDSIRKLIHALKYDGRPEIGIVLGKEAGRRLNGLIDVHSSVLVPVPLHKKRLRKRGYNQTDMICAGINETMNISCEKHLLVRLRNNVSQTTLNAEKRSGNVKGIFGIGEHIKDKDRLVILVDDVITTGATTKEAASVLKNSGYNNIFAISIATVK